MRTLTIFQAILAVAVLMTVLIAIAGCGGSNAPKRMLLVAVDYSGSVTAEERADYTRKVLALADRQYGEATVRYYVFARSVEFVWEGQPAEIKDMISVSKEVQERMTAQGKGTKLGPSLREFAKQSKSSELPVFGGLYTDGDCFDPVETKAAAQELAEDSTFKCLLLGPLQISRLKLENGPLSPLAESGKLITYGKTDVVSAYDRFVKIQKESK